MARFHSLAGGIGISTVVSAFLDQPMNAPALQVLHFIRRPTLAKLLSQLLRSKWYQRAWGSKTATDPHFRHVATTA
jgi:hypothetical protein